MKTPIDDLIRVRLDLRLNVEEFSRLLLINRKTLESWEADPTGTVQLKNAAKEIFTVIEKEVSGIDKTQEEIDRTAEMLAKRSKDQFYGGYESNRTITR